MKSLLIAVAFAISCQLVSGQKYPEKYDNMNLDEVLSNKRLLNAYINCVLDKGKCSPEGKDLKMYIGDALQTGCSKCTNNQKSGAKKVIMYLIQNEPETWKQLVDKYDPQREYSTKYENELNKVKREIMG